MGKSGNAKQRAISAVSEFGNTLKAQGATRRSAIRMLQQQSAHVRNSGELHAKNHSSACRQNGPTKHGSKACALLIDS